MHQHVISRREKVAAVVKLHYCYTDEVGRRMFIEEKSLFINEEKKIQKFKINSLKNARHHVRTWLKQ